jgi:hypothetical protein
MEGKMTTKEAIAKRQVPTWNEWMAEIEKREQDRQDRMARIGYRRPIGFSYDHA